ncbi:MAG TPA: hypothetical protein EYG70_05460 [Sulfurimonas sp.]|nr:hypothetical protein [Sulfurimonas sp.]
MITNLREMGEPLSEELSPPLINGKAQKAVLLIVGMQTQWKYISNEMTGAVKSGLDYSSLQFVAKKKKIKITRLIFAIIQRLEILILNISRKDNDV